MKVLITGADGMLGRDVAAAADAVHHEVVALDRAELDITDERAVHRIFERELPRVVVNCAAYTDVDGAEENEYEATRDQRRRRRHSSPRPPRRSAPKVYYPSTDYVFDGLKTEPYVESDEVNPVGAYGRSKLAGEIATAEANPRHVIVRSSWLYGLDGKQLRRDDARRSPQQPERGARRPRPGRLPDLHPQLAEAIVELVDFEKLGVMHIAGGEYCSWYDFAREIFRQAQLDVKVLSAHHRDARPPRAAPAVFGAGHRARRRPGAATLGSRPARLPGRPRTAARHSPATEQRP